MQRLQSFILPLVLLTCLIASVAVVHGAVPSADKLYPNTTQGFISVPSMQGFTDRWNATQIGKLMRDPVMEAFVKDAQRQLNERMIDRFGFSLTGIEEVSQGEFAAGLVTPAGVRPGFVTTLDVTGKQKETLAYLDKIGRDMITAGAKRSTERHAGEEVTIYTFPREAGASAVSSGTVAPVRYAAFLITRDCLVMSDQKDVLLLFQSRLHSGNLAGSLSEVASYQTTMKRCLSDMPNPAAVDLKFFINPLSYGEAVRTLLLHQLSERRQKRQSIFSVLSEIGFDALRGVGGTVSLKTEDLEVVYRVAVDAPKPHTGAMNVIALPNSTEWTPPQWMPRDLARCTLMNVDPLKIYDHIGPLFDGVVAQEKGVWNDVMNGLKDDPNGPQIDVRAEIVAHLGSRVASMSRYEQPIHPQSESVVIVIALKPNTAPVVAKSLEKLFAKDPQVQQSLYKDCIIWQNNVEDFGDVVPPVVSGLPPLVASPSTPAVPKPKPAEDEEEPAPIFPQGGVTVAHGALVLGTNVDYMLEIIDRLGEAPESIGDSADYRLTTMVLDAWGITNTPHCFQTFIRTDESVRPSYELIRQGKMPQSEAVLGKLANALFATPDAPRGTVRRQQIDGSKMPDFESIRRSFGPAGAYAVTEESGWFIKGCLLEK